MRKHSEVVIIVSSKVDKLMQENKNQNVDMVLAMNYFKPFIAVQSLDMFIYLGRDIQIFPSSRRLACNVSETVNLQPSFTSIPSKLYRMYKVSFINWSFREYSPRSYKI